MENKLKLCIMGSRCIPVDEMGIRRFIFRSIERIIRSKGVRRDLADLKVLTTDQKRGICLLARKWAHFVKAELVVYERDTSLNWRESLTSRSRKAIEDCDMVVFFWMVIAQELKKKYL